MINAKAVQNKARSRSTLLDIFCRVDFSKLRRLRVVCFGTSHGTSPTVNISTRLSAFSVSQPVMGGLKPIISQLIAPSICRCWNVRTGVHARLDVPVVMLLITAIVPMLVAASAFKL